MEKAEYKFICLLVTLVLAGCATQVSKSQETTMALNGHKLP